MESNTITLTPMMCLQRQKEHLEKHISELEEDKVRNKQRLYPLYILLDNLNLEISKLECKEDK